MAKSYKAYGEIEITDISDSKQLTSFIESQLQRQVIYDPNDRVYLPNYATKNNVLTPQLFITGNMDNIIAQADSVKWFYQVNSIGNKIPITGNTTDYTLNTTTKQLTIKTNVLQNNISMNYIVEIVYTDPDTDMDVKTVSTIELVKITNGVHGVDGDSSVVLVLSNDTHTFSSDADGLNINFSGANTDVKVYEGVTDVTSAWSITANPSTGITGFLNTTGLIYTVTNITVDSGYVDFVATKGSTVIKKRFTLTKVRRGVAGVAGKTPVKGTDYFDGVKGQDGTSSYLWIMYSQNANGSGMVDTPANAKYIGVTTTPTNAKPTLNTNYTWSLFKGSDGIKGETGTDGRTSYLHIKYSSNGTSFTANNGETMGDWMGTYVDFTEADSTVFSAYSWVKIKGETGSNGLRGLQGETGNQGIQGIKGVDGKTPYTHIAYATNSTGTSGFSTSESLDKTYIGMYTDFVELDSTVPSLYNWTLIKGADGSQGIQGVKGTDGKTPYLHIAYATNSTGTSGFSTTDSVAKTYIGQYTDYLSADSETPSKYKWTLIKGDKGDTGDRGLQGIQGVNGEQGIAGVKGVDGRTPYTHIAYASNNTGTSGFSTSDSNRTHIGMYTDFTESDSTDPTKYKWSLVKGADGSQGIQGQAGADGRTPYLHIAYANNGTGTSGFSTVDSVNKSYIGQYTDYTINDSNTPADYQWTLIKGDKGEAGDNAQILYLSSDAEAMTFNGLNQPSPATQTITITAKLQNITGTPAFVASPYNQAGTKLTDITLGGSGVTRTLTQTQWLNTFARVVITATLGNLTDKITIVKLSSGTDGRDGLDGLDGDDGIAGRDGVNSYTHIAYANNSTGTSGFSTSDGLNKLYIGMYTDSVLADSSDPTKYKWTLIKGADGSQGIQGAKGADGRTPYFHVAYANSSDGVTGFSTTDSNRLYIGQYTDYLSADSSTPSSYKWTLIKGDKGDTGDTGERGLQGLQGVTGNQGIQGIKGVDGKTSYTHIAYANSSNGVTGFSTSDSVNKLYIGMYTDFIATDSETPSLYNWTLIKGADGSQGIQGVKGVDGKTPYLHIAYATNATGTTGFSVTDSVGKTYIGQYTDYLSADSSTPSAYKWTLIKGEKGDVGEQGLRGLQGIDGSQGVQGIKGVDGKTSYTHIAYANNSTGTSGFSVSDSANKSYIGMYTDFIETDSTTASLYNWTLIKGADGSQGIQGVKGVDGQTPYFHIAYATNSTGTSGFSTTVSDGKTHIGQYTDYVSADSADPAKYDWTLIKGSDGTNGVDAIVGYLSNEAVTFGASPTGVVGNFSSASGIFKVFEGLVDVTGMASVTYTKVSNTGCTVTISSNGAYSVSAMPSDMATAVLTATYKGVVITKTLVLSKSKTGTTGDSATAYWITNSVGVIKKNDAGAYVPSTITVNALSQSGTGLPTAYAGRFIISETINGTTWVDKYTSTVNETSKTYTPSAGITSLRVRMYLAGGATSLVDEQNIPVVTDGLDPVIAILSTPLGSVIKNNTGNLTVETNLYKGGNIVNATSYKWYELDTSVAGGWRQLTAGNPDGTTGYTTKTLTVTPASITSLSTYKVEAVYNGLTYSDMVTLVDLSDPISTIIIGSGIYKNGQGTNSYTARLYRNGTEIDVNGTTYLYKWNILNNDGTLNNSFTATGKTISIPASVFDDSVQLKCDVDDRK